MYFYIRFHSLFYYIFSKPVERRRRKAIGPEDGSQLQLRDAILGGWRFFDGKDKEMGIIHTICKRVIQLYLIDDTG